MSTPQSPLSLIAGTAHCCTFSELVIHPLPFQEVLTVVPFVESRERTRERDTHIATHSSILGIMECKIPGRRERKQQK
jgi:hypothetical protein